MRIFVFGSSRGVLPRVIDAGGDFTAEDDYGAVSPLIRHISGAILGETNGGWGICFWSGSLVDGYLSSLAMNWFAEIH